jgi:hypothetical protein
MLFSSASNSVRYYYPYFCRWGNWSAELWSNLFKIILLLSDRSAVLAWVWLSQSPYDYFSVCFIKWKKSVSYNIFSFKYIFLFFWCDWGLNLKLHTCKTATLPLEPHLQSIFSGYFGRWNLMKYLPRLALNLDPPNFSPPKWLELHVCTTSTQLFLILNYVIIILWKVVCLRMPGLLTDILSLNWRVSNTNN